MKYSFVYLLFISIFSGVAQDLDWKAWNPAENKMHMQFLSSDELQGRKTGEQSNRVAARYIAEWFEYYGVKPMVGDSSYFQAVGLNKVKVPSHTVTWLDSKFNQGESFLAVSANSLQGEFATIFLEHAISEADYADKDVKGKIIISLMGDGENKSPQAAFGARQTKIDLAKAQGAAGVVEIFTIQAPWPMIVNFLNKERVELSSEDEENDPFYGIIKLETDMMSKATGGEEGQMAFDYAGVTKQQVGSSNVIGFIEGTDPAYSQDYILISAHYDHVGTGAQSPDAQDTIFNGARDNAIGVVGLLSAAKILAENPPKRSVIFAAWTAEEIGLLGSRYFTENPLVPLQNIKFNLNNDGAGYTETTLVGILGLDRVGAGDELKAACAAFGLEAFADPAPEQGLFDRSDNVNFAQKGIPAPTFSPGFTEFTSDLMKYYHQPGDHHDDLDYTYLDKFWKAFTYAGQLIADKKDDPKWSAGDKYEEAAKKLYQDN